MGDKEKTNEIEEVSFINKLKKYILLFVCLFLVMVTSVYVTYIVTHKDNNRNTNVYKEGVTPVEVINKNLVEAFGNITSDGLVNFNINQDDLNQMLLLGQLDHLNKGEKSVYVEVGQGSLCFYVDLRPTLGVKTRISHLFTVTSFDTVNNEITLVSSAKRMGKLKYLGHNHIETPIIADICRRSNLPITIDEDNRTLKVSPKTFLDYLPSNSYFNLIKQLIEAKPDVISLNQTSIFGFTLDLSSFKTKGTSKLDTPVLPEDIISRITSSITPSFISSLDVGVPSVACQVSLDEYASLFTLSSDQTNSYEYSSSLVNTKVTLSVSPSISVTGDIDTLTYTLTMYVNGFGIDLNISTSQITSATNFQLNQTLLSSVDVGGYTFNSQSEIGKFAFELMNKHLTKVNNSVPFISTSTLNNLIIISFKDEVNSFDFSIVGINFMLKLNNSNSSLVFEVTKVI